MIWLGAARLDIAGRRIITAAGDVRLTPREAAVLALLPPNVPVEKERVRHDLWKHLADPPEDKSLDVTMCRLRPKLAPLGVRIENAGWRLVRLVTPDSPTRCPMCGHEISDPDAAATPRRDRPTPDGKGTPGMTMKTCNRSAAESNRGG